MKKFIFNFIKILSVKQLKNLISLQIMMIFMSLLEVISVVSIVPFMAIVTDQSLIQTNQRISFIFNYFNFESTNQFLFYLGLFVMIIFCISILVSIFTTWRLLNFSQRVGSEISISLFKYYIDQNWIFHSQHSANEFSRKIFEEVKRLTGGIISPLINLNNKIILSLMMVSAVFFVNPQAASISVLVFFIFYLATYLYFSKTLLTNSKKITGYNIERFKLLTETFGAIKEIIVNHNKLFFYKKFEKANLLFASSQARNQAISQLPKFLIELIAIGSILILILYLIKVNGNNVSTIITTLSIFALAGIKLLPALQQIYASISTIKGNIGAFYSIKDELTKVFENKTDKQDIKNYNHNIIFNKEIKIRNLNFKYPKKNNLALNNISLNIKKGSKIAFVGKSGSGKSTLIESILGLLENSSGSLFVDNIVLDNINITQWQKKISFVPQNFFLFNSSIRDNITFGKTIKDNEDSLLNKCLKISNVDQFIHQLPGGIDFSIGQSGALLSGGQKQRIALARALYKEKEILILDEATNSLDLLTEKLVISSIFNEYVDKTVILISHNLDILKNCDWIYRLSNGELVDQGTFNDLMSNDKYFEELLLDSNKQNS